MLIIPGSHHPAEVTELPTARFNMVNEPPVANANGPYSFSAGLTITFDGTGSSDPNGDPLTYYWAFGDGSSGTGATPEHTFSTAGYYDVCLTEQAIAADAVDGKGSGGSCAALRSDEP